MSGFILHNSPLLLREECDDHEARVLAPHEIERLKHSGLHSPMTHPYSPLGTVVTKMGNNGKDSIMLHLDDMKEKVIPPSKHFHESFLAIHRHPNDSRNTNSLAGEDDNIDPSIEREATKTPFISYHAEKSLCGSSILNLFLGLSKNRLKYLSSARTLNSHMQKKKKRLSLWKNVTKHRIEKIANVLTVVPEKRKQLEQMLSGQLKQLLDNVPIGVGALYLPMEEISKKYFLGEEILQDNSSTKTPKGVIDGNVIRGTSERERLLINQKRLANNRMGVRVLDGLLGTEESSQNNKESLHQKIIAGTLPFSKIMTRLRTPVASKTCITAKKGQRNNSERHPKMGDKITSRVNIKKGRGSKKRIMNMVFAIEALLGLRTKQNYFLHHASVPTGVVVHGLGRMDSKVQNFLVEKQRRHIENYAHFPGKFFAEAEHVSVPKILPDPEKIRELYCSGESNLVLEDIALDPSTQNTPLRRVSRLQQLETGSLHSEKKKEDAEKQENHLVQILHSCSATTPRRNLEHITLSYSRLPLSVRTATKRVDWSPQADKTENGHSTQKGTSASEYIKPERSARSGISRATTRATVSGKYLTTDHSSRRDSTGISNNISSRGALASAVRQKSAKDIMMTNNFSNNRRVKSALAYSGVNPLPSQKNKQIASFTSNELQTENVIEGRTNSSGKVNEKYQTPQRTVLPSVRTIAAELNTRSESILRLMPSSIVHTQDNSSPLSTSFHKTTVERGAPESIYRGRLGNEELLGRNPGMPSIQGNRRKDSTMTHSSSLKEQGNGGAKYSHIGARINTNLTRRNPSSPNAVNTKNKQANSTQQSSKKKVEHLSKIFQNIQSGRESLVTKLLAEQLCFDVHRVEIQKLRRLHLDKILQEESFSSQASMSSWRRGVAHEFTSRKQIEDLKWMSGIKQTYHNYLRWNNNKGAHKLGENEVTNVVQFVDRVVNAAIPWDHNALAVACSILAKFNKNNNILSKDDNGFSIPESMLKLISDLSSYAHTSIEDTIILLRSSHAIPEWEHDLLLLQRSKS